MRRDLAKCHILGGCAPGPETMTPKFELGQDCCTVHLPPSSIILCFVALTNTHTHTHKQMQLKTSNILCYATTLGKKCSLYKC